MEKKHPVDFQKHPVVGVSTTQSLQTFILLAALGVRDGLGAPRCCCVLHNSSNTLCTALHRAVRCGSCHRHGGGRLRPLYAPRHRGRALRRQLFFPHVDRRGVEAVVEQATGLGPARAHCQGKACSEREPRFGVSGGARGLHVRCQSCPRSGSAGGRLAWPSRSCFCSRARP